MTLSSPDLPLFGSKLAWSADEWTSSDDRVRGGASVSHLEVTGDTSHALFTGVLDIDTLGGAGFASQRTTSDEPWDLTGYEYLKLVIGTAATDDRRYTLVLKDTLLPLDPVTGREQSTISYEADFALAERDRALESKVLYFKLADLAAHYRGRRKDDAPALRKSAVQRFSIMMRSHFGAQSGPFRLQLNSLSAVRKPPITKSVSFHADTDSYGTFRRRETKAAPTRHERFKQWTRTHRDYVVLASFCVSMGAVILLFGLIDGNKPWTRRPA